jgi:hypothetical protein
MENGDLMMTWQQAAKLIMLERKVLAKAKIDLFRALGSILVNKQPMTETEEFPISHFLMSLLGLKFILECGKHSYKEFVFQKIYISRHGPLKLRTVHFGDITTIYESKVSEQNIFPWLKGTIESRPHTKFQISCSFN